eukprot:Skav226072  [mRNA]  locus=scaffold211:867605:877826:- [translate_table: standard]
MRRESEILKTRKENYQEKLEEYNARLKEVEQEMENNRDICKVYDSELTKIKEDPERIKKQVPPRWSLAQICDVQICGASILPKTEEELQVRRIEA